MIDRGMVKWQPFNAVASGNYMINEVLKKKNKVAMPTLSEDQKELLQEKILRAYELQEVIRIKYYKNEYIYIIEGKIIEINKNNYYVGLDNDLKIFFRQIIDIY